jgi:oxalate decarboxylase
MFRSDRFADISLNQWMALTPPALVRVHLNLSQDAIDALSKTKPVIRAGAARPQAPPRPA